MNQEHLEQIEETPMGDGDIRLYYPNAKIISYKTLKKYSSIFQLLPQEKSYFFLLIEDSPNRGHWVVVTRLKDRIEFFDSYGGAPDSQLKWIPPDERAVLGQDKKLLTDLLKKSGFKIYYNPYSYQDEDYDIQTCGRHCVLRVKTMTEGKDLDGHYKFINQMKNSSGMTYDEVVSFFIRQ